MKVTGPRLNKRLCRIKESSDNMLFFLQCYLTMKLNVCAILSTLLLSVFAGIWLTHSACEI